MTITTPAQALAETEKAVTQLSRAIENLTLAIRHDTDTRNRPECREMETRITAILNQYAAIQTLAATHKFIRP